MQMPRSVAATNAQPSGVSTVTKRIVSPDAAAAPRPGCHAEPAGADS